MQHAGVRCALAITHLPSVAFVAHQSVGIAQVKRSIALIACHSTADCSTRKRLRRPVQGEADQRCLQNKHVSQGDRRDETR